MRSVFRFTLTALSRSTGMKACVVFGFTVMVFSFFLPLPRYFSSSHLALQSTLYALWAFAVLYVPVTAATFANECSSGGLTAFWQSRGLSVSGQHRARIATFLFITLALALLWLPVTLILAHGMLPLGWQISLCLEQIALILSYVLLSASIGTAFGQRSAALGTCMGIALPLASIWIAPALRVWITQCGPAAKWLAWVLVLLPPGELCFRPAAVVFGWPIMPLWATSGIILYCVVYGVLMIRITDKR